MTNTEVNPQPLPPGVDLAQLTEAVVASVRRALEEREISGQTPAVFRNPRITVGIILEPHFPNAPAE